MAEVAKRDQDSQYRKQKQQRARKLYRHLVSGPNADGQRGTENWSQDRRRAAIRAVILTRLEQHNDRASAAICRSRVTKCEDLVALRK